MFPLARIFPLAVMHTPSPLARILTKEWHYQNNRRTLLVRPLLPPSLRTYFMDGPLLNIKVDIEKTKAKP